MAIAFKSRQAGAETTRTRILAEGRRAVIIPAMSRSPAISPAGRCGQARLGDIDILVNDAAVTIWSAKPLVEGGRIKALVVTGNERSPALPNVATLKEAGIETEDVDLRFWYGLFGPKGIPEAIRGKLERAVATVMASPSVRARLAKLDITPDFAPGSVMHTRLANEIANWTRFIDAHGIKPE